MSSARLVSLALTFGSRNGSTAMDAFLGMLPHLFPQIARPGLEIALTQSQLIAPMTLRVGLLVYPPAMDATLAADARRFGIRDPESTAANAALLGWLNTLRRPDALRAVWDTWCATTGADAAAGATEIWLERFNLLPSPNMNAALLPAADQYDGSAPATA